jgi:predicted enzyme related to lactoylglutathione lyase
VGRWDSLGRAVRATVGHFEIPVRDAERAAGFYREVFGWGIEAVAWEGPAYFRVRAAVPGAGSATRAGIDGGLMTGGEAADQPLLVIHLEGAALEGCLERIVAAGGAVDLPPRAVAGMGRFARFRDTEGNRLGLWQRI